MLPADIQPYLERQVRQGQLILFTGAGFSRDGLNMAGSKIPTVRELREQLWQVCFPADPFNDDSTLQDLYDYALIRKRTALVDLLVSQLSVDSASLPETYSTWFSVPWYRVYTLNIDNLELGVNRQFDLRRPITAISATGEIGSPTGDKGDLTVVHLNGTLDDLPDRVTFSTTQYAERLANQEPWYVTCVAELLTHPVIFVGTELNEPPLWQHIQLRKGCLSVS